jgi:hypothetical protein
MGADILIVLIVISGWPNVAVSSRCKNLNQAPLRLQLLYRKSRPVTGSSSISLDLYILFLDATSSLSISTLDNIEITPLYIQRNLKETIPIPDIHFDS